MKPVFGAHLRRRYSLFFAVIATIFLVSCSTNSNSGHNNNSNDGSQKIVNDLPQVSAGHNATESRFATFKLLGQASDSDGDIASYHWEQLSGPAAAISTPDSSITDVQPGFFNTATADLVFRLTVVDNLGASSYSDVTITVPRPSIDAGPNLVANSGDPVKLHVDVYYPPGGQTISWVQTGGPKLNNLGTADSADLQFTAPTVTAQTTYSFTVTVSAAVDSGTDTVSDSVDLTVNPVDIPVNNPPTVSVNPSAITVNAGDNVQLGATANDVDGTIASYLWSDQTASGPALNLLNKNTSQVSFTAPSVMQRTTLTLRVTVTDDGGASASADVNVTINVPPTVNAGVDQTVTAGDTVNLTGSATDSDGSVSQYLWQEVSNIGLQLSGANSASASFVAPNVTQTTLYTLQLTATDNDGATASDQMVVTVQPQPPSNQPPTANAGSDQSVYPGDSVTVTGTGTDSDGSITGYLWKQIPGQASDPTVVITNPKAQTLSFTAPDVSVSTPLTFSLTVTDNNSATASDTVVVTVEPFSTLSGTVSTTVPSVVDSDVNDPSTTPVANDPSTNYQHIPNPVSLGGYVHTAGVGPIGANNSNATADDEDVYHVLLNPGQVVNLYLGQSYFDPATDPSNPTQPTIEIQLSNDFTANNQIVNYGYASGSSGVLSLTAPAAADAPADSHYLIIIQAGAASAYSYVLTVGSGAALQTQGWSTQQEFVPNELIVEFKDPPSYAAKSVTTLAQRAASIGMQALGGAPGRSMLMSLGDTANKSKAFTALGITAKPAATNDPVLEKIDTIRAARALQQRADVKSVRLNYIYHPAATVPDDTYYSRQWHYPLINLPQAWDITTGSSNVTVAVIDTGILSKHPDIDPNRLVDGYDFIKSAANAGDGDGIDPDPEDVGDGSNGQPSSFHGTHVAGTIAANTNNGKGVAGIAWQVNIMPLRTLGINGGTEYDIEQAIRYAAQLPNDSGTVPSHKADVVNMSLGGPISSTTPPTAYTLARNAGVILIAAAGNNSSSNLSGPAAYDGVVSVSAVTMNKKLASYSNFGSTIDVAAPGGDYNDINGDGIPDAVLSTRGDDSSGVIQYVYDYAAGTSMATPHVAGVAALMKSVYAGLTPDKFDSMLANGDLTQDLGTTGRDNSFGYGLIDAQKAVTAAQSAAGGTPPPPPPPVLAVTPASLNFGSQLTTMDIDVSNSGSGTLTVSAITEDSGGWMSINAASVDAQKLGRYTVSVSRANLTQGLYTATISVVSNVSTVTIPVTMQVLAAGVSDNAGPQVIELFDVNAQKVELTLRVQPTNGAYNFTFNNIRHGTYTLRSSSDLDNDGTLCELGESCGAYPTLDNTVSSNINVDGSNLNINGLNFDTGFSTNLKVP